ncbi:hypothetical protein WN943_027949 [Citrus x changshan-huyou]
MLSGSIPSEFGDSLKLQGLYLGNNQLTGSIPGSLGQLGGLVKLNLTRNKFSGPVPISLGNLKGLSHLDLSSLNGELPSSLSQLLSLVGFMFSTINFLVQWMKSSQIQYHNFCKSNIIGDGGFGTVYKATLPDGKTVAVKKFSQAKTQGHRQFTAEMETLGKVKHQSLVLLLGYCSFDEESYLWFTPHIIHRDIKASNILLDEEFDAKVVDFRLARLISACETHVSTDIAGTLGYIPPEYGQSRMSTTRGDVYSFGVILLELVTGKEPTGPEFQEKEGANLVRWVFRKMKKQQADDVLDPTVLNAGSKPMMLKMLRIAADCVADNPATRPTMVHVLKLLHEIVD